MGDSIRSQSIGKALRHGKWGLFLALLLALASVVVDVYVSTESAFLLGGSTTMILGFPTSWAFLEMSYAIGVPPFPAVVSALPVNWFLLTLVVMEVKRVAQQRGSGKRANTHR